jgi:ParB family chromosome partitioning protein
VVKVATEIGKLKIKDIETNPYQPRKDFDEESLAELADSIRQQGVITPITVRRLETGKYQLIAGERRLRAAKMAKLTEIPAYIRTATDQQMMEMAIVENVQRENLNAMEIALSYSTLIEECGLTQEQLSEKVGKNRSTITNYLRLLKLPAEVQIALKDNTISMAHARAMITIEDADIQLRLLREIIDNDLSVRQTESLAKSLIAANSKPAAKKSVKQPLPELHENTKQELKKYIQSEVEIKRSRKGKGSLTIYFNNDSDFQRIVKIIQNK